MKALLCVLVSLLQTLSAQAPDRGPKQDLEPVASALTHHSPPYHLALRKVLFEKAPRRSLAQFLVLPSFRPEMLASVYRADDGFEAQVTRAEKDIWGQGELEGAEPMISEGGVQVRVVMPDRVMRWDEREVGQTPCRTTQKKLSDRVAARLQLMWRSMLQRTRYQRSDTEVIDGTSYVFVSYERGIGWWSGQTHSPAEGTRAFVLVELGEALVEYVECEPEAEEEALSRMNRLMDKIGAMVTSQSDGREPPEGKR